MAKTGVWILRRSQLACFAGSSVMMVTVEVYRGGGVDVDVGVGVDVDADSIAFNPPNPFCFSISLDWIIALRLPRRLSTNLRTGPLAAETLRTTAAGTNSQPPTPARIQLLTATIARPARCIRSTLSPTNRRNLPFSGRVEEIASEVRRTPKKAVSRPPPLSTEINVPIPRANTPIQLNTVNGFILDCGSCAQSRFYTCYSV